MRNKPQHLEDRIFLNFKEAIETYLRIGFEFDERKILVLNDLEVTIKSVGHHIWRATVYRRSCSAN